MKKASPAAEAITRMQHYGRADVFDYKSYGVKVDVTFEGNDLVARVQVDEHYDEDGAGRPCPYTEIDCIDEVVELDTDKIVYEDEDVPEELRDKIEKAVGDGEFEIA